MIKFLESVWDDIKQNFVKFIIMIIIGFGYGKMFAYASIVSDCQVLGAFRVNNVAIMCKVSEVRP